MARAGRDKGASSRLASVSSVAGGGAACGGVASVLRCGLRLACPRCGGGALYDGVLTLRRRCPRCGFDARRLRSDDGPAAFATLMVGGLACALVVGVEFAAAPPLWVYGALLPPVIVAASVVALRYLKALFIASAYRNGVAGRGVNRPERASPGFMTARAFRCEKWPTLTVVLGCPLLVGLGLWQLERLAWKNALIAQRLEAAARPPQPLPAPDAVMASPASVDFTPRFARGRYLPQANLYLAATGRRGGAGYHVFTPLRLAAGEALFVNRGWIPRSFKDSSLPLPAEEEVEVRGLLRLPSPRGAWTPENDVADNHWFYVDLAAMARAAGLEAALPYWLEADEGQAQGPGTPRGGHPRLVPHNPHLGYAVTWFMLAAALAVVYVLYGLRGGAGGRRET